MKVIINYDVNGNTIHTENEDLIFARSITRETDSTKIEEFLVKKAKSGLDASHLMNPNSMWFVEGSEGSFNTRSGKKTYELSKATKNCFDLYIRFLQTKNPAYLRNAERETQ